MIFLNHFLRGKWNLVNYYVLRFNPGHKLDEKFYVRQDGTRTYYFTLEELSQLFLSPYSLEENSNEAKQDASENQNDMKPFFELNINEYVFRETVNFKESLRVPRVFIQSKFVRNDVKIK